MSALSERLELRYADIKRRVLQQRSDLVARDMEKGATLYVGQEEWSHIRHGSPNGVLAYMDEGITWSGLALVLVCKQSYLRVA
ncbi:hypothetical protein F3I16_16005 [Pseudomonas sp. L-22-4S-12]|uniref:hypothetical protein n=1 Tax=Pseudomonas sp. L-22-4S-12 TaxID=2610893 RepID=UPI0013275A97|nr:hypothetical protein [Pseudomonas sp. L-22-4S-12]MWV17546.1 hypothetical protein [Pseudomonas sp. L-22-4S-12]